MQNKILLATLLVVASWVSAHGQTADPYNTYQWNRQNVQAGNGKVDSGDWYEWWYYKVVIPETHDAFFFTYGVVNPWDVNGTSPMATSVVQVGNFTTHTLATAKFPVTAFSASYDQTNLSLGENSATDHRIVGHVVDNGHEVSWDLSIDKQWGFNAMGWGLAHPDISNIYWYPAQASARMSGTIVYDGRVYDVNGAPGYQDRNWGRSFPNWWTWLVSNNFKNSPGTTLAAGGGAPKAFNSVTLFDGICIGLNYQGKEYAFRSTDADHITFDIHWGTWNVTAENKSNQRIEISAYAPPEKFLLLPFNTPQGAPFYDYEALTGQMTVKLFKRSSIFASWKQVAQLETDEAGIEWGSPDPVDSVSPNSFSSLFGSTRKLQ